MVGYGVCHCHVGVADGAGESDCGEIFCGGGYVFHLGIWLELGMEVGCRWSESVIGIRIGSEDWS